MTLQEIRSIPAIDFHTHYGPYNVNPAYQKYIDKEMPGGLDKLLRNNRYANIALSIVSHLMTMMPRGGGHIAGNDICLHEIEKLPGVYMLVTLNPTQPGSFEQAERILREPKCLGIKVHPEEHCYPIKQYGEQIYEFAAAHQAAIITHSGEQNSMPEDYAVFANRYPEVKTIVSHLGCGWDGNLWHQVRAIERSVNDNLFTDTSSAQSIRMTLLENCVAEIGSEKILFGTDSACYSSPAQRARVDTADISDDDKLNILYRNGLRIFPRLRPIYEAACAAFRPIE